jgi:hypothetical protein
MTITIDLLPGETIAQALIRYQLITSPSTEQETIAIPPGTSIVGDPTRKTTITKSMSIPFLTAKNNQEKTT